MRNRLILFLLAVLLVPLLAACGSTGTGNTGAGTTATAGGATENATTGGGATEATAAMPATEAPTEAATSGMAETTTAMTGMTETATDMAGMTETATSAMGGTTETATAMSGMTETATAGDTATGGMTATAGDTATAGATTAAGETATATGAGAAGGKKLKIGMVTDIGKLDDKSFNASAWKGVQMGAQAIGGESKYIETQDPNDYEKNINQFVSEGYDVIVTVGFLMVDATTAAAKANPKIHFIGVDQFQSETIPNLTGLVFEEDKAGYLAGALAASYSKSGKLGAVLGTDSVPPVWKFGEGYRAGAKSIKPDISVQTVYHNDVPNPFTDPEWGKTTALSMIDQGVDVVFGAGGQTGNGALYAAAERKDKGVVAIGVDQDQYDSVPEARPVLLSSAMKIIDQGVADLIKQVSNGSIKGGNFTGKVGLASFHDLESKVPADVKSKLEQIRQQLDNGSLKTNVPPTKPQ